MTGQTSWDRPPQSPLQPSTSFSPSFQNAPAQRPSIRSMLWSAIKEDFKAGFAEGLERNLRQAEARNAAAQAAYPPMGFSQSPLTPTSPFFGIPPVAQSGVELQSPISVTADQVYVNGTLLDKVALLGLKLEGYQPPPNHYWYDRLCGAWGIQGGPCLGILAPGKDLGGSLQRDASSPTNTSVFINGRRIHTLDWVQLLALGIVGTPGFYWLDAVGYYGRQGSRLPLGFLMLQGMAVTSHVGASAFVKRELDPNTLFMVRLELEQAIAARNRSANSPINPGLFSSGLPSNEPFPSTSPNGTNWQGLNDLFGDLGLGNNTSPSSHRRTTDRLNGDSRAREDRRRREAEAAAQQRRRDRERERAERTRREQEERAERTQREREERAERVRREQEERAERTRREQEQLRRRQREAWQRYTSSWAAIRNNTASRTHQNPYDAMPWPTMSGRFEDVTLETVESFFRRGLDITGPSTTQSSQLLAHLRMERARWHPDRIQRYFASREIDARTVRAVTEVSQIINGLHDAEDAKV